MMKHKGSITLETERLILRRICIEDSVYMFKNWASDDEVTKFLTWPTHTDISVSENVINSWLPLYEKPDYYHWTIILKELGLGEPIGTAGAVGQRDDIQMVHIGYCIGRNWWNKGYVSEALAELIRFFFEEVGVNCVQSRFDPRNPNSGKVMAKCGMKHEGTLRQSDLTNQGICDATYYSILKGEYFALAQNKHFLQ
jgi:ribosomal-protein-alanine N-acetyltransferase